MTCYTAYQLYDALNQESKQLLSDIEAKVVGLGFPGQYNPQHVPAPLTVAHISRPDWCLPMLYVWRADVIEVF